MLSRVFGRSGAGVGSGSEDLRSGDDREVSLGADVSSGVSGGFVHQWLITPLISRAMEAGKAMDEYNRVMHGSRPDDADDNVDMDESGSGTNDDAGDLSTSSSDNEDDDGDLGNVASFSNMPLGAVGSGNLGRSRLSGSAVPAPSVREPLTNEDVSKDSVRSILRRLEKIVADLSDGRSWERSAAVKEFQSFFEDNLVQGILTNPELNNEICGYIVNSAVSLTWNAIERDQKNRRENSNIFSYRPGTFAVIDLPDEERNVLRIMFRSMKGSALLSVRVMETLLTSLQEGGPRRPGYGGIHIVIRHLEMNQADPREVAFVLRTLTLLFSVLDVSPATMEQSRFTGNERGDFTYMEAVLRMLKGMFYTLADYKDYSIPSDDFHEAVWGHIARSGHLVNAVLAYLISEGIHESSKPKVDKALCGLLPRVGKLTPDQIESFCKFFIQYRIDASRLLRILVQQIIKDKELFNRAVTVIIPCLSRHFDFSRGKALTLINEMLRKSETIDELQAIHIIETAIFHNVEASTFNGIMRLLFEKMKAAELSFDGVFQLCMIVLRNQEWKSLSDRASDLGVTTLLIPSTNISLPYDVEMLERQKVTVLNVLSRLIAENYLSGDPLVEVLSVLPEVAQYQSESYATAFSGIHEVLGAAMARSENLQVVFDVLLKQLKAEDPITIRSVLDVLQHFNCNFNGQITRTQLSEALIRLSHLSVPAEGNEATQQLAVNVLTRFAVNMHIVEDEPDNDEAQVEVSQAATESTAVATSDLLSNIDMFGFVFSRRESLQEAIGVGQYEQLLDKALEYVQGGSPSEGLYLDWCLEHLQDADVSVRQKILSKLYAFLAVEGRRLNQDQVNGSSDALISLLDDSSHMIRVKTVEILQLLMGWRMESKQKQKCLAVVMSCLKKEKYVIVYNAILSIIGQFFSEFLIDHMFSKEDFQYIMGLVYENDQDFVESMVSSLDARFSLLPYSSDEDQVSLKNDETGKEVD